MYWSWGFEFGTEESWGKKRGGFLFILSFRKSVELREGPNCELFTEPGVASFCHGEVEVERDSGKGCFGFYRNRQTVWARHFFESKFDQFIVYNDWLGNGRGRQSGK
jgi:hypothetical protein